jgi:DNA-binding Lrp family transcriptional regulator
MDALDRDIINALQGGFPICEHPYRAVAEPLGITEDELIVRLQILLEQKVLSRFGPLYHAERMGGAFTLAAMAVPEEEYEDITRIVNAFPQVAHNYRRDHALNMWFVLATDTPQGIDQAITEIENATGLSVIDLPKEEEYFLQLRLTA